MKNRRKRLPPSVWILFVGCLPILWLTFLFSWQAGAAGEQALSEEKLLKELIREYFSTWSNQDMQAYRRFFHPGATIYYIDRAGNPHAFGLDAFINGQQEAHRRAPAPMVERPTQTTLTVRGRLAQAAVRWELRKGKATITGTNKFTFLKTDKGWKILSLVFEKDKTD